MGGMHGEVAPGLLSYSATRVPCCFRDSKVMPHPQALTAYHIPGYPLLSLLFLTALFPVSLSKPLKRLESAADVLTCECGSGFTKRPRELPVRTAVGPRGRCLRRYLGLLLVVNGETYSWGE